MKIKLTITLGVLAFLLLSVPAARGQERADLSMRRALYFTGTKTDKIDKTKGGDRYVSADGTITVKQSEATKCEGGACTYNIGFIAFRSPASSALSTYALLQSKNGLVGNTIYFAPNAATRESILPLKLARGENQVTFQIDPYQKTAETDENNNSFTVTIIVAP